MITVNVREIAGAPKNPLNNRVKTVQRMIPIVSTGNVLYQKSFPKIRSLKIIIQLNFYIVEIQCYEIYISSDI